MTVRIPTNKHLGYESERFGSGRRWPIYRANAQKHTVFQNDEPGNVMWHRCGGDGQ